MRKWTEYSQLPKWFPDDFVLYFLHWSMLHPLKESDVKHGPPPLTFPNFYSSSKALGSCFRIFPSLPSLPYGFSEAEAVFLSTTWVNERRAMASNQKDPVTTGTPSMSGKCKEPWGPSSSCPCCSHLRFCLWSTPKGENSEASLIEWTDIL